jgi:hypothetical protein
VGFRAGYSARGLESSLAQKDLMMRKDPSGTSRHLPLDIAFGAHGQLGPTTGVSRDFTS